MTHCRDRHCFCSETTMRSDKPNRRKFISAITSGAAGSLLATSVLPFSSRAAVAASLFDVDEPGSEYLFSEGITYLNTGTIGPCRRETIEGTGRAWEDLESLPVKFYGKFGAEELAEKTRTIAARFLGCGLDELVLTTSTTNGMNAIAQGLRLRPGDRVLTTDQEHGGGILCWKYLAKYSGVAIDTVPIPCGEQNADVIVNNIRKKITRRTRLISISHVFSSTGLRTPVAEISSLARSKGILCIVDGAQAAGAINVNVKELGCHAYATSGHKWLMGPKGTGLLYLSKDAQQMIRPMQFEESHNTYTDGNGVVNLACILGLGKAIEYLAAVAMDKVEAHNLSLRDRLYYKLQNVPNLTVVSPAPGPLASPMLACLLAERFERTAFVKMLFDKYKLSIRPTHKEFGFNGIRFSMHIFNTVNEVDRAAEILQTELTL